MLLTADPASVAWLAGYETAPHVDAWAAPPLVLVEDSHRPALILPDHLAADVGEGDDVVVYAYPGFAPAVPEPQAPAAALVRTLVRSRRVATDGRTLPAFLSAAVDWRDAGTALVRARAVKDAEEL